MSAILFFAIIMTLFCLLALNRVPLWLWAGFSLFASLFAVLFFAPGLFVSLLLVLPALALAVLAAPSLGQRYVSDPFTKV